MQVITEYIKVDAKKLANFSHCYTCVGALDTE